MTSRAIRRCVVSFCSVTEIIPARPDFDEVLAGDACGVPGCCEENAHCPCGENRVVDERAAEQCLRPPATTSASWSDAVACPGPRRTVCPSSRAWLSHVEWHGRPLRDVRAPAAVRYDGEQVMDFVGDNTAWAISSICTRSTHGTLALTTQFARTRSSSPSSRSIASARSIRPLSAASAFAGGEPATPAWRAAPSPWRGRGARRRSGTRGGECGFDCRTCAATALQRDGLGFVEEPRSRRLEAREAEVEEEAAGELPRWPPRSTPRMTGNGLER